MKYAGYVLPAVFLLGGVAVGRFAWPTGNTIPGSLSPPASGLGRSSTSSQSHASTGAAPPGVVPDKIPLPPRPAQPELAELWDFLQALERATTPDDLRTLWDSLPPPEGNPKESPSAESWHRLMIERWAELDPAGAIAFHKKNSPDKPQHYQLIFQTWARLDPESALTALQAEPDKSLMSQGVAGFLSSFREEPVMFIRWARRLASAGSLKLQEDEISTWCPDEFLIRLLKTDPSGLEEIAAHLDPSFAQHLETLKLLQQATTDLPGLLSELKAHPLAPEDSARLARNLVGLSLTRPAAAIALLDALSDASGGAPSLDGIYHEEVAGLLLKHLAKTDPSAAAAFLSKHVGTDNRIGGIDIVFSEIFATDPAGALVIAEVLPPYPTELIPLPSFKDRQAALEILPSAPPSWRRDRLIQSTLDQWQRESPTEVQAWVDNLPPGEWHDRAAAALAGKEIHQNLLALDLQKITLGGKTAPSPIYLAEVESAATMAAQSDLDGTLARLANWPPGPARQSAMEAAGVIAANQSTAKALAWAQQIPDPYAAADAVRGVIGILTQFEPLAASEWLSSLTPGALREAAVDRFSEKIAELDPMASLSWAATLSDPVARDKRLKASFQKWLSDDPTSAAAGLAEIPGLSPQDRKALVTTSLPSAK